MIKRGSRIGWQTFRRLVIGFCNDEVFRVFNDSWSRRRTSPRYLPVVLNLIERYVWILKNVASRMSEAAVSPADTEVAEKSDFNPLELSRPIRNS